MCDYGYKLEGDTCIVDESCIKIRHLEDGCRILIASTPAVASFFAVDYCAGTAVLPSKLGDLSTAFKILENDLPLGSESFATIIPRAVENYVTIAVDVSQSVTDNVGLLGQLGSELRAFVQSLAAQTPPVGVSVLVFGRFVAEYVPFTTNLQAVDAKLQEMQNSPATVQALVRSDGTALYEATRKAIRSTERMQRLRATVTNNGVLSTGVAVIVTDGRETTNATLDTTLIRDTRVNVISIGISSDIDDADLTAIGRDGSFLAPLATDMTQAFGEITQRVKEAPQRAYLLGYCSPATSGTPTVEVALNGIAVQETAACTFNASVFGSDAGQRCDANYFASYCSGRQCGGFLACGACANPSQCCTDAGICTGPSINNDCRLQDELCDKANQVCVKVGGAPASCVNPVDGSADGGGACSTTERCDPGNYYCDSTSSLCTPVTLQEGQACADASNRPRAEVCPQLNCARVIPTNLAEPLVCRPQARMFDLCAGTSAEAVCESGSSCRNSTCLPRYPIFNCSSNLECSSGMCNSTAKYCELSPACYFSWNEKMGF